MKVLTTGFTTHRPEMVALTEDIEDQGLRRAVYTAERNATSALLAYYRSVMTGSFDAALAAVKEYQASPETIGNTQFP